MATNYVSLFIHLQPYDAMKTTYEIHGLPKDTLGMNESMRTSVLGTYTFSLEGNSVSSEALFNDCHCEVTFSDAYNFSSKSHYQGDSFYLGTLSHQRTKLQGLINVKPSIAREVLDYFRFLPAHDEYHKTRETILRLDLEPQDKADPYGKQFIVRVSFEENFK